MNDSKLSERAARSAHLGARALAVGDTRAVSKQGVQAGDKTNATDDDRTYTADRERF